MRMRLSALALLLTFAAPAVAQQSSTAPPEPATVAKAKKPRLICKTDAELGTRIAGRTCLTWEEWR